MEAKWGEHMSRAHEEASPERTPKKKATKPGWDEQLTGPDKKAEHEKNATTGQSPSPSKQKAAAPAQLTRAPISQPKKKATTPVFQELQQQPALQVVELPPPGVPLAELAPVVVAPPPAAEQQLGPEATRKRTRVEKDEEFQRAVREGAFKSDEGRAELYKRYESLMRRHQRREQH